MAEKRLRTRRAGASGCLALLGPSGDDCGRKGQSPKWTSFWGIPTPHPNPKIRREISDAVGAGDRDLEWVLPCGNQTPSPCQAWLRATAGLRPPLCGWSRGGEQGSLLPSPAAESKLGKHSREQSTTSSEATHRGCGVPSSASWMPWGWDESGWKM